MAIEVEQKFRVDDFASVVAKLDELGATKQKPVRQVDAYFAHPQRDFAATDEALRLRRVGESNVITYKGSKLDATTLTNRTKARREIELPLAGGGPAYEAWVEMLEALGFARVREVSKLRTCYHLELASRELEVALDAVDGLGAFVEIEAIAEDDELDAAGDAVTGLASEFGLTQSERRSYLELLLASDSGD